MQGTRVHRMRHLSSPVRRRTGRRGIRRAHGSWRGARTCAARMQTPSTHAHTHTSRCRGRCRDRGMRRGTRPAHMRRHDTHGSTRTCRRSGTGRGPSTRAARRRSAPFLEGTAPASGSPCQPTRRRTRKCRRRRNGRGPSKHGGRLARHRVRPASRSSRCTASRRAHTGHWGRMGCHARRSCRRACAHASRRRPPRTARSTARPWSCRHRPPPPAVRGGASAAMAEGSGCSAASAALAESSRRRQRVGGSGTGRGSSRRGLSNLRGTRASADRQCGCSRCRPIRRRTCRCR